MRHNGRHSGTEDFGDRHIIRKAARRIWGTVHLKAVQRLRNAVHSKTVQCLRDTVHSKAVTLCFLGMGGLGIGSIFAVAGVSAALIAILAAAFLCLVFFWLLACGFVEQKRIDGLERLLAGLPEKYLLGEVLPKPVNSTEKRYFRIMREVSASAVGIAEQARREKEEYSDYVESWIHEMKTPLTACSLILDNGGDARKLRRELKRADNLTESILYYARLRTAEKDVKISRFSVSQVVGEAVKDQMALLIGAGISVETEGDFRVYSDEKSLCFILKQLLINCAKYCPGCRITIKADAGVLSVQDNGPGIPAHELPRVTERGFTGGGVGRQQGVERNRQQTLERKRQQGTGMGLYIVRELCRRLDITMRIESREGEFTCITFSFDSMAAWS
ncbi:MAG: HAMP domain-containing histidine kinase [Lachnospiraceae bacterium]|jgi:signal transduction histidine kinase|nr:HAMP domain-containing histidine kinase [Lachnospiraceae bacterium]